MRFWNDENAIASAAAQQVKSSRLEPKYDSRFEPKHDIGKVVDIVEFKSGKRKTYGS